MPLASCATAISAGVPKPSVKSRRTTCPGPFGATMITSWPGGRRDAAVVDVEAVREEDGRAVGEVRRDLLRVHVRLHLVGQQHATSCAPRDGLGAVRDGEPGLLGACPRRAALAQPDHDLDARVVQVQRVRVALAAVAEDGDLAGEQLDVAVAVDGCHVEGPFV